MFEDAFELEEEPVDTIFVITEDERPFNPPSAYGKKIIGGRDAEDRVITFLEREYIPRIKIFVNNIPSKQFVTHLKLEPVQTTVIVAKELASSAKENMSDVREFAENDWNELAKILTQPGDGISLQKAAELEDLKTYLNKPPGKRLKLYCLKTYQEPNQIQIQRRNSIFTDAYVEQTFAKMFIDQSMIFFTWFFVDSDKQNITLEFVVYVKADVSPLLE